MKRLTECNRSRFIAGHLIAIPLLMAATFFLLAAPMLQAQESYTIRTMTYLNGASHYTYTNGVLAATTYNTNSDPITLTKFDQVAFQISYKYDAAGDSNVTFTFQKSIDGTNWATLTGPIYSITANGTTAVSLVTNYTADAVGFLRLYTIANPHATANITNLSLLYSLKPQRTGGD